MVAMVPVLGILAVAGSDGHGGGFLVFFFLSLFPSHSSISSISSYFPYVFFGLDLRSLPALFLAALGLMTLSGLLRPQWAPIPWCLPPEVMPSTYRIKGVVYAAVSN